MNELKLYTKLQKTVAMILYLAIVVAIIITIAGVIWTIADLIMAEGKLELFQGLNLGYQIAIIGGFLAGTFILLVIFYGLFKKGIKFLLKTIYKDRELAEKYKKRRGVQIVAVGSLVSIFIIIVGLVIALLLEILTGLSFAFLETLSTGQVILFIGILMFIVIGLGFSFVFLYNNGYYVIIKMITKMEEED